MKCVFQFSPGSEAGVVLAVGSQGGAAPAASQRESNCLALLVHSLFQTTLKYGCQCVCV